MSKDKKRGAKSRKNKITQEIVFQWVKDGFFDEWKTLEDVIQKFQMHGFTIKGKKKGLVAQLLTYLCQENVLIRELLPANEQKKAGGKWKYKKYEKGP